MVGTLEDDVVGKAIESGKGSPITPNESPRLRLDYPQVHGYTPDDKARAFLVSLGSFFFVGGLIVSKWVAIAPLATVPGVITAG